MAAVEWEAKPYAWNPQQPRAQPDEDVDNASEDSDDDEAPERPRRSGASGRSQRVRANSDATHSGVACQVRPCAARSWDFWTRGILIGGVRPG